MNKISVQWLYLSLGLSGFVLSIPVSSQKLRPDKVIVTLLKAEKEFERDVNERGQKLAYLEVLTSPSLVLRPEVLDGRTFYLKSLSLSGDLHWDPVWAEVSKDGYFGYTTGPFRYGINDTILYGEYVSIWRREPFQTQWKLFVDGGINHSKPIMPTPSPNFPNTITQEYPAIFPSLIEQSKDILLSTDVLLATLMSTRSDASAYEDYLTKDARLLEDGHFPIKGKDSILSLLTHQKGYLFFRPAGSYVDYANDMGFTHGTGDFIDNNRKIHNDIKFSYLRIWRLGQDGLWRIALELRVRKS